MPITSAELTQIILDVWNCTLGMPLHPVAPDKGLGQGALAARVRISGLWEVTLILRCRREAAARWAATMFNRGTSETSPEDVRDALGELANMVAGNVKGILAGESRLSLPVVGEWYLPEAPRSGHVVASVHLAGDEDPVHVFLLAVQPANAALN